MRLIDADALINRMYHDAFEIDTDMQKWDSGCWIRYKLFENAIDEQPTIESKQEWIPCSERLPEEGVGVLAQYGDGSIFAIDSARPNLWKDITVIDCQIVAWMPLPKPWKGTDDD